MPPTTVEATSPQDLSAAILRPRGRVEPSPTAWRDQILYFLLPDRFSDGGENGPPARALFDRAHPDAFLLPDKRAWMDGGKRFQGGTLKGIQSKLAHLSGLGVTTLWVGPVWKQRADLETYHGYGIQDFLEVDPRFGTRQDLRDLVDAAHALGMYVLLDVIFNHSGNNWFYDENGNQRESRPYRFTPPYPFHGFRSATGNVVSGSPARPDDAVWPREFQNRDWYTRAGSIGNMDPKPGEDPLHPNNEFRRGDFFDLKDLKTNELEAASGAVLNALLHVYRYWIALTDCDGFRIDTVKHVSFEAARNFCGGIREFAESIGKENFLLLGEVTGGAPMERDYLSVFGRNLDAVLDIGDPTQRLAGMVKGLRDAGDFFAQFSGHDAIGSHRETGRYHVSILDDHDMVGRPGKHRFSANNGSSVRLEQVAHAVGTQLTTLGTPCIYYGTEQAFDGTQNRHDVTIEPANDKGEIPFDDRYIREAMFGGVAAQGKAARFGAMGTEGCHFFDPNHPAYLRIAAIARLRSDAGRVGTALRRGRQYARETRVFANAAFSLPDKGELVAWSRLLFDKEVVIALNTNGGVNQNRGAEVTIDAEKTGGRTTLSVLYRGDWTDAELRNPPSTETRPTTTHPDGRVTVRIDLPPGGMIILA